MVIDGKAGAAERPQHRLPDRLAVVQFVGVGGFKRQAGQMDELQQQPVAGLNRVIIDMARIGQPVASPRLSRSDGVSACHQGV